MQLGDFPLMMPTKIYQSNFLFFFSLRDVIENRAILSMQHFYISTEEKTKKKN
jgi:hypothetical protein